MEACRSSRLLLLVGARLLLLLFLAQVPPFFLKSYTSTHSSSLKYVNNVVFFWDLIVHALQFHILFDINWNEVHVLFNDFQRFMSTKKSDWWSFSCVCVHCIKVCIDFALCMYVVYLYKTLSKKLIN